MEKIRVTQVFEKLSDDLQEQIKLSYPHGFSNHLIPFINKEGKKGKALRFETDEKIYLIRMSVVEAQEIISQDDDYDDDGVLKDAKRDEYEDKYSDDDTEYLGDDDSYDMD